MKLKKILEHKGFIEGVDFTIDGRNITPIEKVRAGKPIEHPAQEEVKDDQGNVIQEAKPAWQEPTTEKYTADLPPLKGLLLESILSEDPNGLLREYLEPFKDHILPDDNANIHAHLNGEEGSWRYHAVPAPSLEQLYDLIDKRVSEEEKHEAKLKRKKLARKALKEADLSKITTIAAVRGLLKEVIDQLDD